MTAIGQAVSARISHHAREWARRRQGTDPRSVCLHGNRIYILPTRAGLIFAAIVFAMLLGAMNYNNNMGFALAFLLTGVGIISIYHCHRNLTEVRVHYLGGDPVFAGDEMRFRFSLENESPRSRWQIRIAWDNKQKICDELVGAMRLPCALNVATRQRGTIEVPRVQLSTQFPLGLFRAWAWIDMGQAEVVYPQPAPRIDIDLSGDPGKINSGADAGGDDDFSELRDYRIGDSPKRIAWKTLARTGEMLVKEYRGSTRDLIRIDWNDCPESDFEARISRLTRLVLDSDSANHKYGLRLPGTEIPPGQGAGHRHHCLRQLALHGSASDRRAVTTA